MVNPEIVLFANEAFYLAFNNRDLEALEKLWARHTPPGCIHPGWSGLYNRNEIMKSWQDIFSNENAQQFILCHNSRIFFQQDIMSVICFEQLAEEWLIATNNFVLEEGDVRIFHHQASQCFDPPDVIEQIRPSFQ